MATAHGRDRSAPAGVLEDEHWHRVAAVRLRLRPEIESIEQRFRGVPWIVLRDPISRRFHRVRGEAARLIRALDGRRTLEAVREEINGRAGDIVVTESEAVEIVAWLCAEELVSGEGAADASLLHARRLSRSPSGVELLGRWLAFRMVLWNPDRWLDRVAPAFGWILSGRVVIAWCLLLAVGYGQLLGRTGELARSSLDRLAPSLGGLVSLACVFVATKLLHELAHGITCKLLGRRSGSDGSVPAIGILWVALLPIPFVDASSSWALSSKWHRMLVASAGMMVELALGALAAIVWTSTAPGLLNSVALDVVLLTGLSAALLNANPLLKFDGYYVFSDWIEIPNLERRARQTWLATLRSGLGSRATGSRRETRSESLWLHGYGALATVFRAFVLVWLLSGLAGRLPVLGTGLALLGVGVWFALPLLRGLRFLTTASDVPLASRRRLGVALAATACLLLAVPLPDRRVVSGVIEPVQEWIHLEVPARLIEVMHSDAEVAATGPPLAVFESHSVTAEVARAQADLAIARTRGRAAFGRDPQAARRLSEEVQVLEGRLERARARRESLRVFAPFAGRWIHRELETRLGSAMRPDPNRALGQVVRFDALRLRAVAGQELGPRMVEDVAEGTRVALRLEADPSREIEGVIERVVSGGQTGLPAASLGALAGGNVRTEPLDPSGREAREPFFEVWIRPLAGERWDTPELMGLRARVRLEFPATPLAARLWNAFRQLLQRRVAA